MLRFLAAEGGEWPLAKEANRVPRTLHELCEVPPRKCGLNDPANVQG